MVCIRLELLKNNVPFGGKSCWLLQHSTGELIIITTVINTFNQHSCFLRIAIESGTIEVSEVSVERINTTPIRKNGSGDSALVAISAVKRS